MKKTLRRLAALLCVLALCLTPASALSVEDAVLLLEAYYVDTLPAAAYEATTLDELFEAVGDPYTYYMPAEAYQSFNDSVEQEVSFTGIGVTIDYSANGILITSLLSGGGAEAAELEAGDLIVAIDGVSCVPAEAAHRNRIIGEAGTFVELTVRRTDGTTKDFHVERRLVEIHNTTVAREGDVVTIDCDSFGSMTRDYFFDGIVKNPDAKLWVIDLRGNTGGMTGPAIYAIGLFTGLGYKLFLRDGDHNTSYNAYVAQRMTEKPVIILVNGYSASSSEILAGGIRAEQAGIILGSRTYGKGCAQILIDENSLPQLFDKDAIKITMSRFYNNDGCTTDRIGVLPTLLVDDEYTEEVLSLLSVEAPSKSEYLILTLNGIPFYVDLEAAASGEHANALSELLSALPPDASITLAGIGGTRPLGAAQALAQYGDPSFSRFFTDVASSPYATEINTLGAYEILGGVGEGRFAPNATLTRAQLAAMLAQALDLSDGPDGLFSDVPAGQWYTGKIGAIANLGLMDGVGDGRFDPEGNLTQEQFITVMGRLARFLNFKVDDYAEATLDEELEAEKFAPLAPWARLNAMALTEYYDGNMLYTTLDQIDPHALTTRAQAAATLCNILKTLHLLSY